MLTKKPIFLRNIFGFGALVACSYRRSTWSFWEKNIDDSLNIRKCVRVSRDLEEHLDVDDEVAEKYTLDVSSPGLNNALRIPRQYKKLIGKTLKIKTYEEEDLVVKLLTVEEDFIEVKNTTIKDKSLKGRRPKLVIIDETPYKVEYKDIKKARLHFEI